MNKPESPNSKSCAHCPTNDALAHRLIKTSETASRKKREWFNSCLRILEFLLPCNSLTLIPVIYDMYAGKIGSTQGDKKDSAPAPTASNMPAINIVSASIPPILIPLSNIRFKTLYFFL